MLGSNWMVSRQEALNPKLAMERYKKRTNFIFRIFHEDSGIGGVRYH